MDAQNILFGMIKNAEMLQPHSEGDYIGQDGLLKCGKCHGMKQMTLDILGEKRIVPVVCNCEADRMREEDARRKAADIEDRIKNLRRIGITDERYSGMVFEADDGQDERTGRICRRYCENFRQMEKENIGLLLYGPRDTGKTFFASCIVNELIRHQYACMITSGPAMISSIQANYGERKEKVLETVQSMRLLVLDDLGV